MKIKLAPLHIRDIVRFQLNLEFSSIHPLGARVDYTEREAFFREHLRSRLFEFKLLEKAINEGNDSGAYCLVISLFYKYSEACELWDLPTANEFHEGLKALVDHFLYDGTCDSITLNRRAYENVTDAVS